VDKLKWWRSLLRWYMWVVRRNSMKLKERIFTSFFLDQFIHQLFCFFSIFLYYLCLQVFSNFKFIASSWVISWTFNIYGGWTTSHNCEKRSMLRTMCGSRTGGWSLPCVISDWQRCVDWFLAEHCRCRLRLDWCWCRWRTSAKGRRRW
jgi:hypothetical protein